MMELNATNGTSIHVKDNSVPVSTLHTNSSNHRFDVTTTRLPTYNGTRTLDEVIFFIVTVHPYFGHHTQEEGLKDEFGILLTNGSAAQGLLLFCDKAAVWANHQFAAHASAGEAWEDFPPAVKPAFIPPDGATSLIQDWESLWIKSHERVTTFNQSFRVLQHQLEPHAPLSDKCIGNSYQLKLKSNPKASSTLIEKLGSQPTVSLNNIMEHVSRVDAMLNSLMQIVEVTCGRMKRKQINCSGRGSYNRCCYVTGEVGHTVHTFPNKEKFFVTSKEKKVAKNKWMETKEKQNQESRRQSHGSRTNCGYGGAGGGHQHCLHLAWTSGGDNDNAKVL